MINIKIGTDVLKDIRLMIFDKDGTLIDLYTYWANMVDFRVTLAQKKLGFDNYQKNQIAYAMGIDKKNKRLRKEGPVGLKKREVVMQAMINSLVQIGFLNTYDVCYEIFREVDRLSVKFLPDIIKPIDGMYDLINTLHKHKCMIAIATTDKTERAKLAMRFLGISDKVDIVVGEDMVENCKPYPDMVNFISKELSVDKKNTVIVGDAITDVEMGINARLYGSIGVASGLATKEKLLEITPYVVSDISKISVLHQ